MTVLCIYFFRRNQGVHPVGNPPEYTAGHSYYSSNRLLWEEFTEPLKATILARNLSSALGSYYFQRTQKAQYTVPF